MLQKKLDIPFQSEFPAAASEHCTIFSALAEFKFSGYKIYYNNAFVLRRDGVWKYFIDKCAQNLHVVLSMSPSGDSLRNHCRSFPGLVGNTTIDWVHPWPTQALKSVAKGYISENRKIPDGLKDAINDHVVHVHESLRHYTQEFLTILRRRNYITPKHYLDYVTTYIRLLDEKSSFITKQIARYTDGITKIDDASVQIDLLQGEVETTKQEATKAAKECQGVMTDIENCKHSLLPIIITIIISNI